MAISDTQIRSAIQALMNRGDLSEQQMKQKLVEVANKNGIAPDRIAANSPFSLEQVNRVFTKFGAAPVTPEQEFIGGSDTNPAITANPASPGFPQTGLIGAENALQGGFQNALQGINTGTQDALATLGRTGDVAMETINAPLNRFSQPGGQAFDLQAALSGAKGAPAQQQAFDDFQASPGQEFLRERGQRALINQAAALGGLGGGNVRKALVEFGTGVAAQDFQNQFDRLGSLSNMGLGAAGQQAALGGNVVQSLGLTGAGFQNQAGRDIGNLSMRTGESLASGRTRTGELQAQAIGDTTSALASLQERHGTGLKDILGAGGGNLAEILRGAGLQEGQSIEQLATILANIRTGQGSQLAGLPGLGSTQQTQGILQGVGQAAEGIGTAMALSDMRLKDSIVFAGKHPSGLNLYTWEWNEVGQVLAGDQDPFGVMAQEAMVTHPDAVTVGVDGYLQVDYSKVN